MDDKHCNLHDLLTALSFLAGPSIHFQHLSSPIKMSAYSWLKLLQQHPSIAVIRASQREQGYRQAKAVAAGGMRLIEITWNSDRAAELISQLRQEFPHLTIGTGTLLTLADLQTAITAGSQFLFTPHTDPVLIQAAIAADIPIIPGALSPTEIVNAWQAGATAVKVFPISAVGGAGYLKSLQGPLGQIPLIPTGGVTIENAKEFLEAGAVAVGLAGDLFPKSLVDTQNWEAIASRTQTFIQTLSRHHTSS